MDLVFPFMTWFLFLGAFAVLSSCARRKNLESSFQLFGRYSKAPMSVTDVPSPLPSISLSLPAMS